MDKSRFFHEATLHICGNLEIEEALQELLRFLKDVMPAARLLLQRYDHGFNAAEVFEPVHDDFLRDEAEIQIAGSKKSLKSQEICDRRRQGIVW